MANLPSVFAKNLQAIIVYHAVQPVRAFLWQADFNFLPRFESVTDRVSARADSKDQYGTYTAIP
jgi:hypothetical protein